MLPAPRIASDMLPLFVLSCVVVGAAQGSVLSPRIPPRGLENDCPDTEPPSLHIAVEPPALSTPANGGGAAADATDASVNHGEMTYFNLGVGSCGIDDTGKDELDHIVALSHLRLGEASNTNPLCNRMITIRFKGKTTTATVRDKCMGCAEGDVDVSMAVFTKLVGSLDEGRVEVEWWLN